MYARREIAEDVLIETQTRYDYGANGGPIAVYQCEDCGQFHLTSKGPMNEKLARALAEGAIGRQKEANRWLDKFRKK
jgi:hypothetical protein